jgi:hypothetical protein
MQSIEQPTPQQLSTRKSNLQRKQRQRAREKARSHQAMLDHLEGIKADRMNADGIARRIQRGQCMLGEISPVLQISLVRVCRFFRLACTREVLHTRVSLKQCEIRFTTREVILTNENIECCALLFGRRLSFWTRPSEPVWELFRQRHIQFR